MMRESPPEGCRGKRRTGESRVVGIQESNKQYRYYSRRQPGGGEGSAGRRVTEGQLDIVCLLRRVSSEVFVTVTLDPPRGAAKTIRFD